jgi:hypothetical protein
LPLPQPTSASSAPGGSESMNALTWGVISSVGCQACAVRQVPVQRSVRWRVQYSCACS